MRNQADRPKAIIVQALMALALCWQMPLAGLADEAVNFVPETATIDTTPSTTAATATPSSGTTTLYGSAKKHLKPPDTTGLTGGTTATQNPPVELGVTDNDAALKAATAANDAITLHAQAVKKFDAGLTLSADEYRSLDAGCAGYESDRTFFQDIARVSVVYKDSPAEKAGIRKGDKLIDKPADNDDQARSDPTQPRQQVTCGRAGTPVDITVLRNGKPEVVTLVRMNIEDIQEPRYRHQWEQILRQLGYPKEGSYSGTSLKNLKPVQ